MNKNDLVRVGIDLLVCTGVSFGTYMFTQKRADEMVDSIPKEDGVVKGCLKAFCIGAIQGAIVSAVATNSMLATDNLVQKIQKK